MPVASRSLCSAIISETARVEKSDVTSHMTELNALTAVTLRPSVCAWECINTAETVWDPVSAELWGRFGQWEEPFECSLSAENVCVDVFDSLWELKWSVNGCFVNKVSINEH